MCFLFLPFFCFSFCLIRLAIWPIWPLAGLVRWHWGHPGITQEGQRVGFQQFHRIASTKRHEMTRKESLKDLESNQTIFLFKKYSRIKEELAPISRGIGGVTFTRPTDLTWNRPSWREKAQARVDSRVRCVENR